MKRCRLLRGASRVIVAVTAAATLAGCSDPEPAAKPPGALSADTAEVSINGTNVAATHDVSCSSTGAVTAISTGDDDAGTASAVDTSEGLTVQFAQIRNLGDFTGDYWAQLDPTAEVQAAGRTFLLNGTANGFNESNPSAHCADLLHTGRLLTTTREVRR
jgi:hypothetical protein